MRAKSNMKKFRIGIVGFGNIGKKRFKAVKNLKNKNIIIEYIVERNKNIKIPKNIKVFRNINYIRPIKVDLIIVALPTNVSQKIVKFLVGKFNLLIEKPITTNLNLIKNFIKKSNINNKIFKIGYNLRFDNGLVKAKKIFDSKKLGNTYYVKITYANGTAKTNSNKVGSLYDMGSHCLNLLQWFFNNSNFYLKYNLHQKNEFLNKKKIDNGFSVLKIDNAACLLHHGFCNWKNIFKFEIYGSKGFIDISSLSKWGDQIVSYGLRKYPSGIPNIVKYRYIRDDSWKNEINFVIKSIINSTRNTRLKISKESSDTLKLLNKIQNNDKN